MREAVKNAASLKDMEDKKQLSLELKPEIARGNYSNLAIITHSQSEFIIDFATMLPGLSKPEITNRMIMTPEHAKRLLNALAENISKYESQFGKINLGPAAEFNPGNNGTAS